MNWIKASEYAAINNCHINTVYKLIRLHKLVSKKIGNVNFVCTDATATQIQALRLLQLRKKLRLRQQKLQQKLKLRLLKLIQKLLKLQLQHTSIDSKIRNTYQLTRIKKINTLILLQKQKILQVKYLLLSEYTDQIIDAYTSSYATFKNQLIALRLNLQQLHELQDLFERCTANFINKLQKLRMIQKDETDNI